eukprot:59778_1
MYSIEDNESNTAMIHYDEHSMHLSVDSSELISITIDGEDKLIDECLLDCPQLRRLKTVIDTYCDTENNINLQNIDRNGIKHILNDYHELLQFAETVDNLEYIYHYLGDLCDINTCKKFNRLYMCRDEPRSRSQKEANPSTDNIVDVVATHILDKIHSHFTHSFDVRSRYRVDHDQNSVHKNDKMLRQRRQRFNMLSASLLNQSGNIEARRERYYDFGCDFYYGYTEEQSHAGSITVSPKYASLKEELMWNNLCTISISAFDRECRRCQIYFQTEHKMIF